MANCPTIEGPCGGEEGLRKKKIYVHYQGRYSEEELTKIFWIEPQTTVEDFFKIFVQQMSFKADPKSFALVLESDDVLEKGMLYSRVENKQDCFVQDLIIMGGTTHPSETTKEKIKEVNGASMEDIDKFIQNRQYRKAKLCCEEILQHSPHDFTALEKLTLVLYLSKHYQEAVVVGERAFACEPTYSPQDIYLLVGRCWLENQDPDEAYSVFRRGIDLFEKNPITNTEGKTLYLNLKAELCRTLFILGRHQEAGALINELMTSANPYGADPQSNVSALLIYAEIAAQYDKIPEALQAGLKALVSDQTNKRAKKLVATVLSHPTGIDELYKQVPPTPVAASAYAFLAMSIKDHSALGPAERLFKRTIEIERVSAQKNPLKAEIHNHVLNLVHVLESASQPLAALTEITNHLKYFLATPEGVALRLREIVEEMDSAIGLVAISSQTRSPTLFFPPILSTGSPPLRVLWYRDPDTEEESSHLVPFDSGSDVVPTFDPPLENAPPLDLLAVLFTAVKILFVQGNLASVTRLIEKVELLRRTYHSIHKTQLHATTIRNEHAYYLCICQVLGVVQQRLCPLPTFPYYESTYFNHNRPIFLCGDSHCLSAAWSQISVPSDLSKSESPYQPRLLIPKLVTGLKQWHLRPESDFYPKEGFHRIIATIPEGSDVILMVGEIDCREGLLVAVERGVYSSLEEGIKETLKVFRSTINFLIQKKKFRVFVHPVNPVLDITRQIVAVFNHHYQQLVATISGAYWLDIFESLLTQGDSSNGISLVLRDEWKLDGTHLNPAYAALLESAFRNLRR